MKSIYQFTLDQINGEYPFTLMDIGAMGGIAKKWNPLSGFIKIIAFEPDDREFQKLKNSDYTTYLNYILYNKSQDLNFYVTKGHGKSSIYEPNLDVVSQFKDVDRFFIENEETISCDKVKTLDSFFENNSISDIDFIKLDTQGTELNILKGGQKRALSKAFGAQIEVEFIEIYKDQPTFKDVDEFMQKNGFQLIDLRRQYWNRKDYYDYAGKGQLVFGDALYFKNIESLYQELNKLEDKSYVISKIYKAMLVCIIYGMFDYAVSVAKTGFDQGYISQSEYEKVLSVIVANSKKSLISEIFNKSNLYRIVNQINRIFRPKSYLGWSYSDDSIGNVRDL